jgi:hypothetical protein
MQLAQVVMHCYKIADDHEHAEWILAGREAGFVAYA